MTKHESHRIITAASPAFEQALLTLLASLNVNWPGHPPVTVYDLGMGESTLSLLAERGYEVRSVPPFCPHWRKHFTWKLWCCADVDAEAYLWLDAATCVLRPIDEAFVSMEALGYFCPTIAWPLEPLVSEPMRIACGVDRSELATMLSISGGVHGFAKRGAGARLIARALEIAMVEDQIRATEPFHRHDQALLSLLLHTHFQPVLYADHLVYCEGRGPAQVRGQRLWHHRRRMLEEDVRWFDQHAGGGDGPYVPKAPHEPEPPSTLMRLRAMIARLRGRTPASSRAGDVVYDGVRS